MAGTIHGRGGKFKVGATVIAEAREWTVNVTRNKDEDEAFGDTWRTQLGGIKEWSMTAEVNFDPTVTTLMDAVLGDVVVAVELYPVGSNVGKLAGNVWLEGDWTVGIGGTARTTVSGDGDGALTWTPFV